MKLSAPPPPPPPPPEQPAGDQPAPDPNNPNANANANTVPPPDAPPAPAPVAKALKWPGWYAGLDSVLVALVLVLTFAAASFAARNSDLWLHLAAGKRLLAGEYTPGADPFSYSGADRPWVNHSWLLDAFAYLLYGGKGSALVVAKALALVGAFGLLLGIRRPRFALWPWAACACAAVLASAPQFLLRPLVASVFFLAVTMFLLFRVPHKPNSWRFPVAIGVTFWLWSNCDQWFFLGPLALALLVLGDLIQSKVLNAPEPAPAPGAGDGDEPLGRLPDTATLVKALGVGVLACMLNPHHVRVWELPFELVGAPGGEADPRVRLLRFAPIDGAYYNSASLGYNLNGLAYLVLFVAGIAALGFGTGRVRASHLALWIGFAALSLFSMYAIPFFAVVAVPLVAGQLNALSAKFELKTWGDPRSRVLLLGSSLGRLVCLIGALALCVLAYPGWVHPDTQSPVYARRVAWTVEADPALVRAAGQMDQWRASGRLPADARGVIANTDLANYVAWFAPREKVFFNARYNHHRAELADYVALRKGLSVLPPAKDETPDRTEALAVLRKAGAEYLAIHASPGDGTQMRAQAEGAGALLYRDWAAWSPWYTDGRTVVFGWRAAAKPSFARLRLDPVVLAFGPTVERLPEFVLKQPLVPLGWEAPFVRPARAEPPETAEAAGWARYKTGPASRQEVRQQLSRNAIQPLTGGLPMLGAPDAHRFAMRAAFEAGAVAAPPPPPGAADDEGAVRAAPLLGLRAARRAIAADPDHPEPYFALAQALADPDLPMTESERTLGIVTALRQCLIRMPRPEAYRRGQFAVPPVEVAVRLARIYLNPQEGTDPATRKPATKFIGFPVDVSPLGEAFGQAVLADARGNLERVPFQTLRQSGVPQNKQLINPNVRLYLPLDTARETLQLAREYGAAELAGEPADDVKKRLQPIDGLLTAVETALLSANEQYAREKRNPGTSVARQVQVAIVSGLPSEALKLLTERAADIGKDDAPFAVLQRVNLELLLGRVEDANENLGALDTADLAKAFAVTGLTEQYQLLKYQKAVFAGEYRAAGELWQTIAGRSVGRPESALPARSAVKLELIEQIALARAPRRDRSEAAEEAAKREAAKTVERMLKPPMVPFNPLLRTFATDAWQAEWIGFEQQFRQGIAMQMQNEAEFFTRRGVLSLLEGDIPAARERFQQARREPPAGWKLPVQHTTQAAQYLQLIERAARPPAP